MTPGAFARGVVLAELGVPLRAARLIASGFRPARTPGYAYDGGGTLPVVIAALALTAIPEMLVLDLLLGGMPWVRLASDVVHCYAVVWMFAFAYALRTDVHTVDATAVTLRTLFMRRTRIARADVIAVDRVDGPPPRGAVRLGLGTPKLRIRTARPFAAVDFLGCTRIATEAYVAVDDAAGLARALTHG